MKNRVVTMSCVVLAAGWPGAMSWAQVPDAALPPANPPSAAAAPTSPPPSQSRAPGVTPNSSFLGKDVPVLDPGSGLMTWDGKNWNVMNNPIVRERFEKYLNAPEATGEEDRQYQAIVQEVLNRLAPGNASQANIDVAFRLLARASNFEQDGKLCDAVANAVYSVWTAQRSQQRLVAANQNMLHEIQLLELATKHQGAATQHANEAKKKSAPPRRQGGRNQQGGNQERTSAEEEAADVKKGAVEMNNWQTRRLAELVARQKANDVKRELSEIQAKVEFQALMVQLFMQRRFQHVLISTRFYRALFNDGDTKLNLGKDATELFQKSTGMPPTVAVLDSLTNEAIRDVREGIRAFEYLVEQKELDSASRQLMQAFAIGEYMPEVQTLPREKKRKVVDFVQKGNRLISAIEVKDYGTAETLVKDLQSQAKDFDGTKALTAVETARRSAGLLLAKARNAAVGGDKVAFEEALKQAAEIWPLNPQLAEMSQRIFEQGDVQAKALTDFDQLRAQKNYRQIYEDRLRFIAAAGLDPNRKSELEEVLTVMQTIETAILRAEEMRKQSNFAGAWESVERVAQDYPNDSKLNQVRADLTTQAAEFVRTLRGAQDLEKRDQVGSSLAWYLKAQKIYPASEFATEGVERLKKQVLPES